MADSGNVIESSVNEPQIEELEDGWQFGLSDKIEEFGRELTMITRWQILRENPRKTGQAKINEVHFRNTMTQGSASYIEF